MIKLLFLSNFIDIAAFNNVVFVKTNRSFSYMEETSSLLGPQGKPGAHGRSEYVKEATEIIKFNSARRRVGILSMNKMLMKQIYDFKMQEMAAIFDLCKK